MANEIEGGGKEEKQKAALDQREDQLKANFEKLGYTEEDWKSLKEMINWRVKGAMRKVGAGGASEDEATEEAFQGTMEAFEGLMEAKYAGPEKKEGEDLKSEEGEEFEEEITFEVALKALGMNEKDLETLSDDQKEELTVLAGVVKAGDLDPEAARKVLGLAEAREERKEEEVSEARAEVEEAAEKEEGPESELGKEFVEYISENAPGSVALLENMEDAYRPGGKWASDVKESVRKMVDNFNKDYAGKLEEVSVDENIDDLRRLLPDQLQEYGARLMGTLADRVAEIDENPPADVSRLSLEYSRQRKMMDRQRELKEMMESFREGLKRAKTAS